MELFTFVQMGGVHENVVVKLLDAEADLHGSLAHFDAGVARCFLDGDRQRLWAVIAAPARSTPSPTPIRARVALEAVADGHRPIRRLPRRCNFTPI